MFITRSLISLLSKYNVLENVEQVPGYCAISPGIDISLILAIRDSYCRAINPSQGYCAFGVSCTAKNCKFLHSCPVGICCPNDCGYDHSNSYSGNEINKCPLMSKCDDMDCKKFHASHGNTYCNTLIKKGYCCHPRCPFKHDRAGIHKKPNTWIVRQCTFNEKCRYQSKTASGERTCFNAHMTKNDAKVITIIAHELIKIYDGLKIVSDVKKDMNKMPQHTYINPVHQPRYIDNNLGGCEQHIPNHTLEEQNASPCLQHNDVRILAVKQTLDAIQQYGYNAIKVKAAKNIELLDSIKNSSLNDVRSELLASIQFIDQVTNDGYEASRVQHDSILNTINSIDIEGFDAFKNRFESYIANSN